MNKSHLLLILIIFVSKRSECSDANSKSPITRILSNNNMGFINYDYIYNSLVSRGSSWETKNLTI